MTAFLYQRSSIDIAARSNRASLKHGTCLVWSVPSRQFTAGSRQPTAYRPPPTAQNPYLTPNCITRGVPAIAVTRPNWGELKFVSVIRPPWIGPAIGAPQLNVFSRLNVSMRSSIVRLTPNEMSRESATSTDEYPGARTLLRGKFPSVPGSASANEAGFNQLLSVLSPYGSSSIWFAR